MKRVRVKDVGIKLNGDFRYKGEEQIVSDEEWKKNEQYLDILEEIKTEKQPKERKIEIVVKDENIDIEELRQKIDELIESYYKTPVSKIKEDDKKDDKEDDKELEELREKAKELAIKNAHNMKKETLIAKIEEIEKEGVGDNPNPTEE